MKLINKSIKSYNLLKLKLPVTTDIDIAQIKANAMNDLNAVVVNVEQKAIAANALKEQADKVQDMIDSNDDATETEN